MSLGIHSFTAAPTVTTGSDRRPSPGLTINLASNNPFRNREVSPASLPGELSASSPFYTPSIQQSYRSSTGNVRNPFFDDTEEVFVGLERSALPTVNTTAVMSSTQQPAVVSHITQDMNNLRLNEFLEASGNPSNVNGTREMPLSAGHRQTRSNEGEIQPQRNGGMPSSPMKSRPSREPRPFVVEQGDLRAKRENRPPARRNSESSVIGVRPGNVNDSEGRKPRGDGRPRERRHADGRPREGKPKRTNHRLDIIDKLDVTSIYGTGLFHHDGPFDACNPHRNRKGSSRAPMQAFAKDSANNVLGGSGPVNKDIDHAQYFGDRGAEAFSDYSKSGVESRGYEIYGEHSSSRPTVDRTNSFNPVSRVDPVHGDESLGLGTSTFLEGAPASRTAIQRRQSESEGNTTKGGDGLTRKKSLAQRIRGLNQNRQFGGGSSGTRNRSPDRKYGGGPRSSREYHSPTIATPTSAGGTATHANEGNPFFSDYDAAYDQKGENIAVAERERGGHVRVPSSPKAKLERRITHDTAVGGGGVGGVRSEENIKPTGGFLSRVRSLRGGRRPQKVL
ncbi:MAG: hypothetical protein M1816_004420 [Peltula sp. TS41687]|nr:MAG: hypothetical protein M1816_004420 [Peltula sp. TS41687]